ncbi:MAG: hypothetical protein FWF53_03195 [Candidatus Azobacteroides sp.]|nr:hypothetical protein [Candidatus Azobacteroides sp.]
MYKPYWLFYLFIVFLATNFFSCKDDFENYSDNPQDLLTFSVDTLSFDTVLTTVNSPVLSFCVYNRNSKPLLISSVQLAEGTNSDFKINVDGIAGSSFENVEILAKDSLYIFVDVKPKENGEYTPTLLNDYIIFETHNIQQKVVLEAYGQDVYTWRGAILSADSVLDNRKPYLIYDSLVIEKDVTVEIGEGCVFYMYNDAQLIVNGTIKVKGSLEKPVIFRGSRTDYMVTIPYDLIPGQWGGIRFASESYDNELENVRIRNGKYGMNLDVCDDPLRSKLYMKNVVLTNVTGTLLQAVNCNITAENCEFSNAKDVVLYLIGGKCRFTHCTIANYYPYNPQLGWINSGNETLTLSNTFMNLNTGEQEYYPVISAEFFNSIIYSSTSAAISIQTMSADTIIPYLFQNCLLPNKETNNPQVVDCLFQVNPLFQKTDPNDPVKNTWYPSFDFRLKEDSPAKDAANLEIAAQIPYDLNGFNRLADGHPDLGAYEYYEEEQ